MSSNNGKEVVCLKEITARGVTTQDEKEKKAHISRVEYIDKQVDA